MRGGRAERAIFYLDERPNGAKATFANREAIAFYESAIGKSRRR